MILYREIINDVLFWSNKQVSIRLSLIKWTRLICTDCAGRKAFGVWLLCSVNSAFMFCFFFCFFVVASPQTAQQPSLWKWGRSAWMTPKITAWMCASAMEVDPFRPASPNWQSRSVLLQHGRKIQDLGRRAQRLWPHTSDTSEGPN